MKEKYRDLCYILFPVTHTAFSTVNVAKVVHLSQSICRNIYHPKSIVHIRIHSWG